MKNNKVNYVSSIINSYLKRHYLSQKFTCIDQVVT